MAKKRPSPTDQFSHGLGDAWGGGFTQATEAYQTWLAGCMAYGEESARFMSQRLKQDLELPSRLASCTSPTDVIQTQTSFLEQMMTDYAEEARRMQDLLSENMPNGLAARDARDR